MAIADIRLGRRTALLREPFTTSRGTVDHITAVEATVVTTDGRSGVGWASPATRLTGETLETLEAALAGRRLVDAAAAAGLPSVVGSMIELPGAVAASVMVASALPWAGPHDLDAGWWLAGSDAPRGLDVAYAPPVVTAISAKD